MKALPALLKEHKFWNSGKKNSLSLFLCFILLLDHRTTFSTLLNNFILEGIHKVVIQDAEGSKHTLSRYYAMWDQPRPESSTTVPTM